MNMVVRWYHVVEVPDGCDDPEVEALKAVNAFTDGDFRAFIGFECTEHLY